MLRTSFIFFLFLTISVIASAQMIQKDGKALYGNEWIDYTATYYKVKVGADSIYRINGKTLKSSGVPINLLKGSNVQLFHNGAQVPVFVSTDDDLGDEDFIEFVGEKNRGELDRFLYHNPDKQQLNPFYSMFTDTSVYFLTFDHKLTAPKRIRSIDNDLSNHPPAEDYFMEEITRVFHDRWYKITHKPEELSLFDNGEGYAKSNYGQYLQQDVSFQLPGLILGNVNGKCKMRFSNVRTGGSTNSRAEISVNETVFKVDNFIENQVREVDFDIDNIYLNGTTTITLKGTQNSSDYLCIPFIQLSYPRDFDFGQAQFKILHLKKSNLPTYLEIESFDGGDQMVLIDRTNTIRIEVKKDAADGKYKVKLPSSAQDREILIYNPTSVVQTNHLIRRKFTNPLSQPANYFIITNKVLDTEENGVNPVRAYASYRSSNEGGSYKVETLHIDEIEDAFAWGVLNHSIGIRQFIQFISANLQETPYVLLIGRGTGYPFANYLKEAPESKWLFIPTFGQPGSDVLLASDTADLPIAAIGRIPAINTSEISIYLQKVKEYEATNRTASQTIDDKSWTKEFIHLSGGDISKLQSEIIPIRTHLEFLENIISKPSVGAHTTTFYKQNLGHQVPASTRMRNRINKGAAFITYLGHSNFSLIDFNIDPPNTYNNKNRYYTFMSLGCLVGDYFRPGERSFGEHHTLIADKGAIVFLGNTTNEYLAPLKRYSAVLYRNLGGKSYGKPFGKVLLETGKEVLLINNADPNLRNTRQLLRRNEQVWSTTYNGDPGIRIPFEKDPDYVIDASSIRLTPESLYKGLDSFRMQLAIVNLGAAIDTSFNLQFRHQLPDGSIQELKTLLVKAPYNRDTIEVTLPLLNDNSIIGLNKILVDIDPDNIIEENPQPAAESNNSLVVDGSLGYPVFITSDDIFPIYPEDFAIVNQPNITLTASNSKYNVPNRKYFFELDTTEKFNSPSLVKYDVTTSQPDVHWNIPNTLEPNVVYYWRVAIDSSGRNGFSWKNHSFIYLPNGPTGWNQSHRYQFEKDNMDLMEVNSKDGLFAFQKKAINIRVSNNTFPRSDRFKPRWYYGNEVKQSWENWMPSSAVAFAVIDPVTGKTWDNPIGGLYGSVNPQRNDAKTIHVFPFYVRNEQERDVVETFIRDIVPKGSMVIFYTIHSRGSNYHPEQWASDPGDNIMTLLEAQGATEIRNLISTGPVPYIFCFKKDGLTTFKPIEKIGNDSDVIEGEFNIYPYRNKGETTTPSIGPGQGWKSMQWDVSNIEPNDTYTGTLLGYDVNGVQEVLLDNLEKGNYDLSNIDKDQYPRLQIKFSAKDDTNHTCVKMPYWRIYYDALPDVGVSNGSGFSFIKDTLNQGEEVSLHLPITNLTPIDMDSLLVKYFIIQSVTNESQTILQRIAPLPGNASATLNFSLPTLKLNGSYKLIVELNPDKDQPELKHFNNFAQFEFYVRGDKEKPLLDVTFDRLHIVDEELVSSRPEIRITLVDNNEFFALKDTSLFDIYLSDSPLPSHFVRQSLSDPDITFQPADLSKGKNKASVIIRKHFDDGRYFLKVAAKDNVGNTAGQSDYQISFRVINKSAISNIVNYPNPFTSSTRFVYTLTGETLPEEYHLQIMTVTGKVVREVSKEELGPLRFGTHMTDFAWDGRDEFGDPLAAGVYLYRFSIKKEGGDSMERLKKEDYSRLSDLDTYFKNDIGKMVLMR